MSKQLDEINSQIRTLESMAREIRLKETFKRLAAIKPKNKTRQILALEEKLSSQMALRKARQEAFDDMLDLIEVLIG